MSAGKNKIRQKQGRGEREASRRTGRGWKAAFVVFLLVFVFYLCHPLIFNHREDEQLTRFVNDEPVWLEEPVEDKEAVSGDADGEENVPVAEPAEKSPDISGGENVSGQQEIPSAADDIAYLIEALNSSEEFEEVSVAEDYPEGDAEKHALQDEQSYKLYEEPLPEDIIDDAPEKREEDGFVHYPQKSITDIDISVGHKPVHFETPVIAVVIDDMGVNVRRSRDIISLKMPLTSSFLTYGPHLQQQIAEARAAGHEIMAHVPMEPHRDLYTAPDGLTVKMSDEMLRRNFEEMLRKFPGVRGINNHMGSKFTENKRAMSDIMDVLRQKDLFFLDSKTTPKSVGKEVAKKYGVKYAHRHVFLDNRNEKPYILGQLAAAEKIARKNGYAVAIGHPKSQTYEALKEWLPTLKQKNITLVPMSRIIEYLN